MIARSRKNLAALLLFCVIFLLIVLDHIGPIIRKEYTADDFGITTVTAATDFDGDGIDDYTDILMGAKADCENHPTYDGRYWGNGGYPPDDIGVCTDVVWRAFKNAGYCLRDMVDADIRSTRGAYPNIKVIDRNIDFRRVPNLKTFFERYALKLTCDVFDIEEWQPGDIVVFGDYHIGIVSDKSDEYGIPLLLHNGGQEDRENSGLLSGNITGHYRFDASLIDENQLVKWED